MKKLLEISPVYLELRDVMQPATLKTIMRYAAIYVETLYGEATLDKEIFRGGYQGAIPKGVMTDLEKQVEKRVGLELLNMPETDPTLYLKELRIARRIVLQDILG